MGVCYSEEEEWETNQNYRKRRKNRKKKANNSIIVEEKTIYESSFASGVQSSFREELHNTLNHLATTESQSSIIFGSVGEMTDRELDALCKSLEQIAPDGEDFNPNEVITLCNLKTKNFLHTHKIRHPQLVKLNEASACPYTSSHILEYDLWKLIIAREGYHHIYHPFTQKFLGVVQQEVICSDHKFEWRVIDHGRRRNGGFVKFVAEAEGAVLGELCMSDKQGLLSNHRQLLVCSGKHIGHLWEINFGECILE